MAANRDAPAPAESCIALEFERVRVPEDKLKSLGSFVGMFAGEHVAGTELLIGPLFVVHGVSAFDVLVGLLVGNVLAVLSWTLLTAPIAVAHRFTLYFHLEKIGGRRLVEIYNVANGILWCCIAAAMISVSATAVGVPFDVRMPELTDVWPTVGMVIAVAAVGAVMAVVAIKGYDAVARFSSVAAPWMVVMFAIMGLAALGKLGIRSPGEFWDKAQTLIWTGGAPAAGKVKFTFWHVMCFAWFGNIAWHIGMGDLTLFRYARKARYGLASAAGMFLGHYMAWIAAGLLYALQLHHDPTNTKVAPGPLADGVAGATGILLVVIAGWTTANPILYRAGLAFQALRPKWPRARVTLVAGAAATAIGIFPQLNSNFLGVAALYGLILMPMGAVIFADHHAMRPLGLRPFFAERTGRTFCMAPAVAWVATLLVCVLFNVYLGVQIFFLALPGWFIAGSLYVVLSAVEQRRAGGRLDA